MQRSNGGFGVCQCLIGGISGPSRIGHSLHGRGDIGLGLLQFFFAALARQIFRVCGLLSFCRSGLRVRRGTRGREPRRRDLRVNAYSGVFPE